MNAGDFYSRPKGKGECKYVQLSISKLKVEFNNNNYNIAKIPNADNPDR